MYPAHIKIGNSTLCRLLRGGAIVAALTFAMPAPAQNTSTAPKIKQNQIMYVTPVSGKLMYEAYCASCHGENGRGNANAIAAMLPPPSDLTLLASQNGGKYPAYRVRDLLMDQDPNHDRAADSMPVWACAFKTLQPSYPQLVELRVHNLVAYLATMQAPPGKAGTDPGSAAKPR